jgi:Zn-dependent protease
MLFSLLSEQPIMLVAMIAALLYGLTVHEFAHAAVAKWQGDDTAEQLGRLSLNPLAHIDLLGLLFMLVAGFGWGKPVPVDYRRFRNGSKSDVLVSLAGIATNFASVIFFAAVFAVLFNNLNPVSVMFGQYDAVNMLAYFLAALIIFNLTLGIFNLIPIPPLDGSHVLFHLLPNKFNNFKFWLAKNGPMLLLALIIMDNFLGIDIFGKLFTAPVLFLGGLFEIFKIIL